MPIVIRLGTERYSAFNDDLAGLFDELPEPLAYFDSNNRLSICNRKFRETFPVIIEPEFVRRYGLESKNGPPSRSSTSPAALQKDIREFLAARHPGQVRFSRPVSHASRPLTAEARPMPNGGTLLTFREPPIENPIEVSLTRKLEKKSKALRAALAAKRTAQIAAKTRADFLTSTSHELRTPLNAILGFSEILKTEMFGPLGNDRYREYAEIIHNSGSQLLSLVNDLLDLSKLDAGKLEMHFESVQLLKVIIDCVRGVETQASNSHVGISVNLYDGIQCLRGDDKRLHQMLLNLLSNAVKFTPEGGEIHVSAFRRGDRVAISVSDSGIGIRPDHISKVLEPFGQIDSAQGRKHVGTGLGLPLTKELAELHGGSLLIESMQDVGTTVTILLPSEDEFANASPA